MASSIPKSVENIQNLADSWNITYTLADDKSIPTLCLNMIVKNESKIIERLLISVAPWIDSYCICDTGSTDNTIEIIELFFANKQIPGKVVQEPFRDFGHNRSFALKACENIPSSDFILLLDADMIFWIDPTLTPAQFKSTLSKADAHYVFQGSERFYYKNTRIVRNRMGMTYWGVTHEYVQVPPSTIYNQLDKTTIFINDIGDGGSKADKFLRDIRLLKQGLETLPNNDRYTFYLANSQKDAGLLDDAIASYRKRIEIGGWHEEIWSSYYQIGHCYKIKGEMGNAIAAWLDAYQVFPDRVENLYEIINYYRVLGKNRLAYPFCVLAKNELDKNHVIEYLFTQKDIYDYKINYELSIIGYYCNTDKYDLAKLSMDVLAYPHLDESTVKNVFSNYKFYTSRICDWNSSRYETLIPLLKTIGQEKMKDDPDFVPSSPSICRLDDGRYVINVRYVNYSIGDKGDYIQKAKIETKNVLAIVAFLIEENKWIVENEVFVKHDTTLDDFYVGIEDIRLFAGDISGSLMTYNGNRGMPSGTMEVEVGTLDMVSGETSLSMFPHIPQQGRIEKNWTFMCGGPDNSRKMIYGWSPLTIGDIVTLCDDGMSTDFVKTHEIATPAFFRHVRGSTNGIIIGDEIWFICHAVSYEDRRYYYHLMVVLDRETFALKKYTPFFTFEKEKVEYTLGFTYDNACNEFLIGYSVMDRRTEYITVSKDRFDNMML